jgi:hypothetical protein
MPYLVPGWELRRMGMSTIVLPSKMVTIDCQSFIPAAIKPDDIIYVGIQADMANHRAT